LAVKSQYEFTAVKELKHSLLYNTAETNNGQQNGLILRTLFSELFQIVVEKVTFAGFKGAIAPFLPIWIRPWQGLCLILRNAL